MTSITEVSVGRTSESLFLEAYENAHYKNEMKSHIPDQGDISLTAGILGIGAVGSSMIGGVAATAAAALITSPAPGMLFQNPVAVAIVATGTVIAAAAGAYMVGKELKSDQQEKSQIAAELASMEEKAAQMPDIKGLLAARRQAGLERAQNQQNVTRTNAQRSGAVAFGVGAVISGMNRP